MQDFSSVNIKNMIIHNVGNKVKGESLDLSTEICVMKSLVGEFTQSGKWSVKGALMGECWKKLCVGIYG